MRDGRNTLLIGCLSTNLVIRYGKHTGQVLDQSLEHFPPKAAIYCSGSRTLMHALDYYTRARAMRMRTLHQIGAHDSLYIHCCPAHYAIPSSCMKETGLERRERQRKAKLAPLAPAFFFERARSAHAHGICLHLCNLIGQFKPSSHTLNIHIGWKTRKARFASPTISHELSTLARTRTHGHAMQQPHPPKHAQNERMILPPPPPPKEK